MNRSAAGKGRGDTMRNIGPRTRAIETLSPFRQGLAILPPCHPSLEVGLRLRSAVPRTFLQVDPVPGRQSAHAARRQNARSPPSVVFTIEQWPEVLNQLGHGSKPFHQVLRTTSQIADRRLVGVNTQLVIQRGEHFGEMDGTSDRLATQTIGRTDHLTAT